MNTNCRKKERILETGHSLTKEGVFHTIRDHKTL